MLGILLDHWQSGLLALLLLVIFYIAQSFKSDEIDFKQFADFPQPEEPDKKSGHWPWIEKSAGAGDPRRSFGMFHTWAERMEDKVYKRTLLLT